PKQLLVDVDDGDVRSIREPRLEDAPQEGAAHASAANQQDLLVQHVRPGVKEAGDEVGSRRDRCSFSAVRRATALESSAQGSDAPPPRFSRADGAGKRAPDAASRPALARLASAPDAVLMARKAGQPPPCPVPRTSGPRPEFRLQPETSA